MSGSLDSRGLRDLLATLDRDAEQMRATGLVPAGSEPLAAQAAAAITALLSRIETLEGQRDAHFEEGKRAQTIIDRLGLQREKMLTASLGRDFLMDLLRSSLEYENIASAIEHRFNQIVFESLGDGVGAPSNGAST